MIKQQVENKSQKAFVENSNLSASAPSRNLNQPHVSFLLKTGPINIETPIVAKGVFISPKKNL